MSDMHAFDNFFLGCLGSKEKLIYYIENDVDLLDYIKKNYRGRVALAKNLISIDPRERAYIRSFDSTKLLNLLKEERPELFDTIVSHLNGMLWLRKQKFEEIAGL